MAKMNKETRQKIVDVFNNQGFSTLLKSDGTDEYQKNLAFKSSSFGSKIFIHRDTGITSAGNLTYLKVAVHPNYFREDAISSTEGIDDFINQKTKINRHSSSNYVGFPVYQGNDEPCGKCYKVDGLDALERLLKKLKNT
jgi:hypothetical protein